jgi:hypothetical protein
MGIVPIQQTRFTILSEIAAQSPFIPIYGPSHIAANPSNQSSGTTPECHAEVQPTQSANQTRQQSVHKWAI